MDGERKLTPGDHLWWMKMRLRAFFENNLWFRLAHWLPRRLVNQAAIRLWADAETDKPITKLTVDDAIRQWERKYVRRRSRGAAE